MFLSHWKNFTAFYLKLICGFESCGELVNSLFWIGQQTASTHLRGVWGEGKDGTFLPSHPPYAPSLYLSSYPCAHWNSSSLAFFGRWYIAILRIGLSKLGLQACCSWSQMWVGGCSLLLLFTRSCYFCQKAAQVVLLGMAYKTSQHREYRANTVIFYLVWNLINQKEVWGALRLSEQCGQ